MKTFRELSANQRRAIKLILDDDEITCLADVAVKLGLHQDTVLKYISEPDFMRILEDAKKVQDGFGAGPDA